MRKFILVLWNAGVCAGWFRECWHVLPLYNTLFNYGVLIFPVVTNRFLGGQVERAAFLSLPELHISVKYKCVNSGKYRGINSCVTWRKMGINCAWRCWLKNKTSQSSSRSTINSLLALFFLFSFIFHWRIVFFLIWNLELSASLKFRWWLKLLNNMVHIYFLCWYEIRLSVTPYENDWLNSNVINVRLDQYFETVIYSRRLLWNHRVTPDLLCLL